MLMLLGVPQICRAYIRNARAKQVGHAQCTKEANTKTGLCTAHEKAMVRREERILAEYSVLGKQLEVGPVEAMMSLIHESAANVQFYRNKVRALERLVTAGKRERWEVDKIVVLYNEERDRLQKYTTDGMRVNLEARQVRLSELQAEAIGTLPNAISDGLNLDPGQKQKLNAIIAEQLRSFVAKHQSKHQWQGPFFEAISAPIEFDEEEVIDVEAVEVKA